MSLISEKIIKVANKEIKLVLSNRALYKAQLSLKKKGLVELVAGLEVLDLEVLYHLIIECSGRKVSLDELLDADLQLAEIAAFMAEGLVKLFEVKKEPELEKK